MGFRDLTNKFWGGHCLVHSRCSVGWGGVREDSFAHVVWSSHLCQSRQHLGFLTILLRCGAEGEGGMVGPGSCQQLNTKNEVWLFVIPAPSLPWASLVTLGHGLWPYARDSEGVTSWSLSATCCSASLSRVLLFGWVPLISVYFWPQPWTLSPRPQLPLPGLGSIQLGDLFFLFFWQLCCWDPSTMPFGHSFWSVSTHVTVFSYEVRQICDFLVLASPLDLQLFVSSEE